MKWIFGYSTAKWFARLGNICGTCQICG